MILYELIKFEEQLLMCEAKNKFEMPFFDYVILNNLLTETEKITNLYFQIINDFKQEKCQEGDNGEKIDRLSKFNNKFFFLYHLFIVYNKLKFKI